ncbi:glycosyltransferase family 2 protein [Lacisediminihabitans sp. H27-G8]|uniref:glycosyltransferase family 2 protein n=1 Tax=Lacisediminihabitans sp. H27-G8 TaxID=3111909 RepID=UPI0038FCCCDE
MITIVSGRRDHLINQHRGLALSDTAPHCYVVVAIDEPHLADWLDQSPPVAQIKHLNSPDAHLPLAAARNLGAKHAIDRGADLLVFLDVDCVPSPSLLARYSEAAYLFPTALLGGAVGYLPDNISPFSKNRDLLAHFHNFRPRPRAGETYLTDPNLFWSLSFALTTAMWKEIGGFHEAYRGYGGEDTDFARTSEKSGNEFRMVGDAEAFHQYHPSPSPPVHHLEDILRNGRIFAERWGTWPMIGWLEEFEKQGLVYHDDSSGDWLKIDPHPKDAT